MKNHMKILGMLASFFGISTHAAETKTMDPKTILFSISTINDALPAFQANTPPGQQFFQMHEDDWRQFEAISQDQATAIDQELAAIRKIHETASVKSKVGGNAFTGFRSLHVRKLIRQPISPGLKLSDVAALSDNRNKYSSFSLSGSPPAVGGFAFPIGNIVAYGQADGERVLTLCLSCMAAPQLSAERANALVALLEKHRLTVVHWPSATKLEQKNQLTQYLTGQPETAANVTPESIRQAFEAELQKRGLKYSIDNDSGRYRLKSGDLDLLISIENLLRDVAQDRDISRVGRFVDIALSSMDGERKKIDVQRLYWCLEPTDHVEKADFHKRVSDRVDRVLVVLSEDSSKVTWVTPSMLKNSDLSNEAAEAAAFENLANELRRARIEFSEIDGVRLGFINTPLPFKSSLILAPNLKACVEETLGWPVHAIAPDRGFLYVWAARHENFASRVGGVAMKEYSKASYPLSTELYSISDEGVRAIGEFSDKK